MENLTYICRVIRRTKHINLIGGLALLVVLTSIGMSAYADVTGEPLPEILVVHDDTSENETELKDNFDVDKTHQTHSPSHVYVDGTYSTVVSDVCDLDFYNSIHLEAVSPPPDLV